MSLGTWDPSQDNKKLDATNTDLSAWISAGDAEKVDTTSKALSTEQISALTPLMKQSRAFWASAAESLNKPEIENLIRFFALAEEHNSQLAAGNDSPVIGLNRALKKRGEQLDKDMLIWLRKNSTNRYLPNGSVL